jgi:hypothetical protein
VGTGGDVKTYLELPSVLLSQFMGGFKKISNQNIAETFMRDPDEQLASKNQY